MAVSRYPRGHHVDNAVTRCPRAREANTLTDTPLEPSISRNRSDRQPETLRDGSPSIRRRGSELLADAIVGGRNSLKLLELDDLNPSGGSLDSN